MLRASGRRGGVTSPTSTCTEYVLKLRMLKYVELATCPRDRAERRQAHIRRGRVPASPGAVHEVSRAYRHDLVRAELLDVLSPDVSGYRAAHA